MDNEKGFKIICEKCGNERNLKELFEMSITKGDDIDLSCDIYEKIIIYCPKCENMVKGEY